MNFILLHLYPIIISQSIKRAALNTEYKHVTQTITSTMMY